MVNKKAIIIILLTLSSIIAFSALTISNITEHSNSTNIRNNLSFTTAKLSKTTTYSQHNPINITNNAELSTISTSGNGSSTNPYLIANLMITNCNSNTTGITVQNTDKYFILRNIIISGCLAGISFSHVLFGSIVDANVSNYGFNGILLNNSENNTIIGNLVSNDTLNSIYDYFERVGINLYNFSNYNDITNNTVEDSNIGFSITKNSNSNNLTNNIASFGEYGFNVEHSNNTILTGNICFHNTYGFYIIYDNNTILKYNVAFDNNYDFTSSFPNINTILSNNKFISYQSGIVTGFYNFLPLLNYQSIIAIIVLIGTCVWLGYNYYIFKKTKKEIGKLKFYFDLKGFSGIFSFLDVILLIITIYPSNSIFHLSTLSTILLLGGGFVSFLGFLIYLFGTSINYGKIAETFSLVGLISQVTGFILSIIVLIDINNSINNTINSTNVSGLYSYEVLPNVAMFLCFIGLIFGLGTYYIQRLEISKIIHNLT